MPNFSTITGNILADSGISNTLGTNGTSGTSGVSGTSGLTGTSGTSGINGTARTSGTSGSNGTAGTSGASGINGTSGSSGTSGVSGDARVSGVSGSNGVSNTGANGASGSSGQNTWTNATGVAGYFAATNTSLGSGMQRCPYMYTNGTQTGFNNTDGATALDTNYMINSTGFPSTKVRDGLRNIYAYNTSIAGTDVWVDPTGNFGFAISSIKYKDNVQSLIDVSWLNQLRPVKYNYRKKDEEGNFTEIPENEINYGLIAEEVQEINESFVSFDILEDGSKKPATVHYKDLLSPMLLKLQQLDERLKNLESQ
jgi:hypothetical protein